MQIQSTYRHKINVTENLNFVIERVEIFGENAGYQ